MIYKRIKHLESQVSQLTKQLESITNQIEKDYGTNRYWELSYRFGLPVGTRKYDPTIKGKIDAIAKHLNLTFDVTDKVVEDPRVTVKKAKQ